MLNQRFMLFLEGGLPRTVSVPRWPKGGYDIVGGGSLRRSPLSEMARLLIEPSFVYDKFPREMCMTYDNPINATIFQDSEYRASFCMSDIMTAGPSNSLRFRL